MLTTLLLLTAFQDPTTLHFERRELSKQFLCEGATFGDLNGDGVADVVAGPWWYEGPAFTTRHALYPAKTFQRLKYSDNFFAWIHDIDRDGRNDIFVVGFPGDEAYWLRNTGKPDAFEKHVVFHGVDNESPWFVDVDGDGHPDLVCQNQDRLGFVSMDPSDPRKPWRFRVARSKGAGPKFTHGLGVGDLNGDGRLDIVHKLGWFEQPADLTGDPEWTFHPVAFSPSHGGAQMLVTDVDGDGDADVVTAYAAHGWGLAWFEQRDDGTFVAHEVLPPTRAPGNVSELHALALADLDGDGLLDVVTGKRWWSHGPTKDGNKDGANDPAVLLGLLLRRDAGGARYVPVVLDDESGVGTQVSAGDVDGDGRCDVVVANKRGTFVLLQRDAKTAAATKRAQDDAVTLDFETGRLNGWTATGDAFVGQPIRGDAVAKRRDDAESGHAGEYWIGTFEVSGDDAMGTLTSAPIVVAKRFATFLLGGGAKHATRVEILDASNDAVLFTATGNDQERMQRVQADLAAFVGRSIRLRLVDEAKGHWGHLNFDDFGFADEPGRGLIADPKTGLEPAAAARAMTTLPGFRVDLIAGEPDLHQPIALTTDPRGRLWVAEAYSYPERRKDEDARDAIVVFEDADGDGTFERRVVFHDRLNLVSGIAVGFGGVFVGAAPHLLFIPDADADLVPDGPPQILLDGFGYQDTHETLNSFTWGPDGWLYGTHGVYTHSRVGKPGTPSDERVRLNAAVWRFHPTRHDFEVFAYGTSNPWGVDFDDRGEAFITACVIEHLWHVVPGGRYERQAGGHFDPYPWSEIGTIADHKHFAGDVAEHAWWGRNRAVADPGTDAAGGGHAHCGVLVYKADEFGPEFRNAILMHNIHGNRINQDRVERQGSSYVGRHAEDVVFANDKWFRGVALRQGPSGEVYFIDWYDRNACHRSRPEIWDRTNGRLYRLTRDGAQPAKPVVVALDRMSDVDLAALTKHRNDWYASTARRLLQERGKVAPEAVAALRAMLRDGARIERLRAMWTLHVLDALDTAARASLLRDADEDVRAWTVRLAAEQPARFPDVVGAFADLARAEPSAAVRASLASALQRLPLADRFPLATALLAHAGDAKDRNIGTLLWYGIEPLAAVDAVRFAKLADTAAIPSVVRFIRRRLAIGDADERAQIVALLARGGADVADVLKEMLAAQKEQPGLEAPEGFAAVAATLRTSRDSLVRDRLAEIELAFGDTNLAPRFRARLKDKKAPLPQRRSALEGLVRQRDADTAPLLLDLLKEPELRRDALSGLAAYDHPDTTKRVLDVVGDLDPTEREVALDTLAARPSTARAFLSAIVDGKASARLLDAASVRRQLLALRDDAIPDLLQKAWGRSTTPTADAQQEIARWKAKMDHAFFATADRSHGRALFARTCQACHQLYGVGGVVGPDLTGSNRSDLEYLLSNIVDPSAEMGREYQLVIVRLKDGRTISGNLIKDTPGALTMRTAGGEQTILRRDLADDAPNARSIEYLPISLMPPGQLQMFTETEVRDLFAYLRGTEQVPMLGSPENVGAFFNGRDLTGWQGNPKVWSVEDGEIVGRTTTGLPHNDFLVSDLLLRDFRLTFRVKLLPDTANSGIQFRSQLAPKGEMKGYQADVGAGWWGLLYEELGRAVLQKAQANPVRTNDWNLYEILAVGDRVQLALNGVRTVDITDPQGAREGVVGLQVHSGGPTEVRFKSFVVELDPKPVLKTVK